jgi:hypothetical protein
MKRKIEIIIWTIIELIVGMIGMSILVINDLRVAVGIVLLIVSNNIMMVIFIHGKKED